MLSGGLSLLLFIALGFPRRSLKARFSVIQANPSPVRLFIFFRRLFFSASTPSTAHVIIHQKAGRSRRKRKQADAAGNLQRHPGKAMTMPGLFPERHDGKLAEDIIPTGTFMPSAISDLIWHSRKRHKGTKPKNDLRPVQHPNYTGRFSVAAQRLIRQMNL